MENLIKILKLRKNRKKTVKKRSFYKKQLCIADLQSELISVGESLTTAWESKDTPQGIAIYKSRKPISNEMATKKAIKSMIQKITHENSLNGYEKNLFISALKRKLVSF